MSGEYLRGRGVAAGAAGAAAADDLALAAAVAPPRAPAGEALPFRRRAVKPRRRRRSRWTALVAPAAAALGVVGLPAAAAGWLLTTPRLALAESAVAGTERVAAGWIEERLAPFAGRNLLALPLAEVEAALAGHPWIAGVSLRKELPRTLAVEVIERRPAALVPGPGGPWLADGEGTPIVRAPAGAAERFLLVVPPEGRRAAAVPAALALAAEVARRRPVWAAGLARIDALGDGDFRLHTRALAAPVTVRAGRFAEGAGWVDAALPALAARFGALAAVDARFPGRLVVRPAPGGGAADDRSGSTG